MEPVNRCIPNMHIDKDSKLYFCISLFCPLITAISNYYNEHSAIYLQRDAIYIKILYMQKHRAL